MRGKRNATNTTLQLEAGYVLVRVLEKSPQGEVSTITKQASSRERWEW